MRATGLRVLEEHVRGWVIGSDQADQEATLDELMSAIERFNRSVREPSPYANYDPKECRRPQRSSLLDNSRASALTAAFNNLHCSE